MRKPATVYAHLLVSCPCRNLLCPCPSPELYGTGNTLLDCRWLAAVLRHPLAH